jgi:CHAT domain-containing protein
LREQHQKQFRAQHPELFSLRQIMQKGGTDMDVIENMYKNSIQASERNMRKDKHYKKAKNQSKQCYEWLCKNLSPKELEKLNKLIKCYDTKIKRKNVYCFKTGFKTGVAVALKSLEE